jgi:exonuclease VII large subunit
MPNPLITTEATRPDHLEMYPLSIERLTSYIEQALTQAPQLRQVWVSGEVSSMTSHPSGIYFTLKDLVGKAVVPAVIWKNQIPELETKPQVGTQILAFGKITVYAPHISVSSAASLTSRRRFTGTKTAKAQREIIR